MSDDFCKPHAHFSGSADSYTCHHFYAIPDGYRCHYCGSVRYSVTSRDASRKLRMRLP